MTGSIRRGAKTALVVMCRWHLPVSDSETVQVCEEPCPRMRVGKKSLLLLHLFPLGRFVGLFPWPVSRKRGLLSLIVHPDLPVRRNECIGRRREESQVPDGGSAGAQTFSTHSGRADPEDEMPAAFVAAEAVLHNLRVTHTPAIPLDVVQVTVDQDLGVRTNLRVEHVRTATDLLGVQPKAQLRQFNLVEKLICRRAPAAVDVLGPAGLSADSANDPHALASHEAKEAPQR